jgi:F-box-like
MATTDHTAIFRPSFAQTTEGARVDSALLWDPAPEQTYSIHPIHRIPAELLCDIFRHYLALGGSTRDLIPVCCTWRDLAYATPHLWSGIIWVSSKPSAQRQGWALSERLTVCRTLEDLRRTLSRAKTVPLDLVFEADTTMEVMQAGLALLTEDGRISQWRKISLHHSLVPYNDYEAYSHELSPLGGNLSGLEEVDISVEIPILFNAIARTATRLYSLRVETGCRLADFPKGDWWKRLRKLEVKVHWMDESQAMLNNQQRHEQYGAIISSCINLEELLLFHVPLPKDWSAPPKLLRLTSFETETNFHNHSFPSTLTHLTIDNNVDHLQGTFSLPCLKHLRYTFEESWALPALGQLIAPALERLELVGYKSDSVADHFMEEELREIWGDDAQSSNRLNPRSLSITRLYVRPCILVPALRHMPAITEMVLTSVLASKDQEFYIPFIVTRRNSVENVVCPRLRRLTVDLEFIERVSRREAVEETMLRLVQDRKKRGAELEEFQLRWSHKEGNTDPSWVDMLGQAGKSEE